MTPEQLAELRRLAEQATPGPWRAVNVGTDDEPMMSVKAEWRRGRGFGLEVAICATGALPQVMEDGNAAFIAAANPATVLALLDYIAELERERQFAAFGAWCLKEMRLDGGGNIDGGASQEAAIRIGLLASVRVAGRCGENCRCAEYFGEWPAECLRLVPGVDDAIRRLTEGYKP